VCSSSLMGFVVWFDVGDGQTAGQDHAYIYVAVLIFFNRCYKFCLWLLSIFKSGYWQLQLSNSYLQYE